MNHFFHQRASTSLRSLSTLFFIAILVSAAPHQASAQAATAPPGNAPAKMRGEPPVMDNQIFAHVFFDQLEGRTSGADNKLRWDGEGWVGNDMNRLRLKTEGFVSSSAVSDGDQEALYDHPIPRLRYFDAQVGVRADLDSGPRRAWAAIGIEGMAPYYFHFAPTLYIRDGGRVAGRVTGSYDLLLTQRLIAQPEAEFNFYSVDDAARKLGSGLAEIDTGVRLRYEISRKFGPYIGFAYNGKYGGTASYARKAGDSTSEPRFIFGVRVWY